MKTIKSTITTTISSFLRVFRFSKVIVIGSIALSCFFALQSNLNVLLSKELINYITSSNRQMFILFASMLLTLQLVRFLLEIANSYMNKVLSEKFTIACQDELINLVAKKDLLEKENPRFKGDFPLWAYGIGKYYESYAGTIQFIQYFFTAVLNLYYMMNTFWILGIYVIVSSLVRGVVDFKAIHKRMAITQNMQRVSRENEYYYYLLTGSENQKELTLHNAFSYFKQKWLSKRQDMMGYNLSLERLNIRITSFGQVLSLINTGIVMFAIAFLIFQGKLTVGDYVAITMAVGLAEMSLSMLISHAASLAENANHIATFRRMSVPNAVTALQTEPFKFQKELTIQNLSFKYPTREENALSDINVVIKKGQKVAIIGDNAAGKSTFIKIILGLYSSPPGTVKYDGVNLEKIDRTNMWQQTSVVFQDFIRYMATIRENVNIGTLARGEGIDRKIKEAIATVGLDGLHQLKRGLDSELGYLSDDSINLSGGQWQRLALARAFVHESELIVLDEPTSALDPIIEADLFEHILNLEVGKTVIVISHRVGIARKADLVLVMKDGTIIESGTHDQLLDHKGHYSQMWDKQSQYYI